MKKFLLKSSAFLLLLAVVDQAAGMAFRYMAAHAKGGYVGHHRYVTDMTSEDILVFGSSRAIHHYNPSIIEDSLGMTCYNCGQDGNGIVLFYGVWQMIRERYKPKMIIYDISSGFDIFKGESNQKYLGWLRGDYDRPGVSDIFKAIDATEPHKMRCQMYRYNSKFLQNITDYLHPIFGIDGNGFLPLKGEMDMMKIKRDRKEGKRLVIDETKLHFLELLIKECREDGVRLVFAVSPSWYGTPTEHIHPVKDLCSRSGVEFIDYSNQEKYTHHAEFFRDGTHMNALGADEYTRDIIHLIR